jgi:hypothetical protein
VNNGDVRRLKTLGHWWKWALGFVLTAAALYGVAATVRKIYLNSIPEIHHVGESPSLPFSVKNNSEWFTIGVVTWLCAIESVKDKQNRETSAFNTAAHSSNLKISPGDPPANFDCSLDSFINPTNISQAQIYVALHYNSSIWGHLLWTNVIWLAATWNGSQWIEGPLNR